MDLFIGIGIGITVTVVAGVAWFVWWAIQITKNF